jgi:hypothetical protein
MKTLRITLVLVAVAAVAFAGVAAANCGSCGADKAHAGCSAKGDCPGWDTKAMTSFEAKVVSIDKAECEGCKTMHVDLVVVMKDEKVTVRLGPAWYLDKQDDVLKKDDVVTVYASKVKHGDDDLFVAGKIVKGDDVLMLRDKEGQPVWQGWRREA